MRTLSSISLSGLEQVKGNEPDFRSAKEVERFTVISQLLEGSMQMEEVVQMLSLSVRQIKRLVKRLKDNGKTGIIHKARGKPSNRKLPEKIKIKVLKLYLEKYKGLYLTRASEKLAEEHNISISHETLRNWLIESGYWKVYDNKRDTIKKNKKKDYIPKSTKQTGKKNGKHKNNGNSIGRNNRIYEDNDNYEENTIRYPRKKYIPAPDHPWRKPIFLQYTDKAKNKNSSNF